MKMRRPAVYRDGRGHKWVFLLEHGRRYASNTRPEIYDVSAKAKGGSRGEIEQVLTPLRRIDLENRQVPVIRRQLPAP